MKIFWSHSRCKGFCWSREMSQKWLITCFLAGCLEHGQTTRWTVGIIWNTVVSHQYLKAGLVTHHLFIFFSFWNLTDKPADRKYHPLEDFYSMRFRRCHHSAREQSLCSRTYHRHQQLPPVISWSPEITRWLMVHRFQKKPSCQTFLVALCPF